MRDSPRRSAVNFNAVVWLSFDVFLPFLCKKDFDIKWESRDLSGSASLALWANMNQSTTQLGSKRQSQGKHLYPAIDIFCMLCSHCLPTYKYFFMFCMSLVFVVLVHVCIFLFALFICLFSPRWFFLLAAIFPLGECVFFFSFLFLNKSSSSCMSWWSYNVLLGGPSLAWTFST